MAIAGEDGDEEEVEGMSKPGLTKKPEPFFSITEIISDGTSKPRDE